MTPTPHDRSRARSRRAAAGRAVLGAALLILLLAAFPAVRLAPAAPAGVRVGGIPIEWWYGGLLAPVVAWIVAVWAIKTPRAPGRSAGATPPRAEPDEAAAGVSPDAGR